VPKNLQRPEDSKGVLRWNMARRRRFMEWMLITPALLFTVLVVFFPLAKMVELSFTEYQLTRPLTKGMYVGLGQYQRLLSDSHFWKSVWISGLYTMSVTLASFLIGLSAALLLNQRIRGFRLARALVILPWGLPSAIAAFIWLFMFQSTFGVINYLLTASGLIAEPVQWLQKATTSLFTIIVVGIWKLFPFDTLVLFAGLQAIPRELYEAVEVDGGGAATKFTSITWPALKYVSTVVILLTGVHAFREFESIYILTSGGPARATETLGLKAYMEAFRYFDFGYGSAVGCIMLIISMVSAYFIIRIMRAEFY
jgi:multiple sugar transport system permease protein